MKKPYLICLCILLLSIVSFPAIAQSVSSIVLDASSLSPINADAITGLALDPIAKDRSNRPCARIKLHINRMTPEEIRGIDVRAIGGNVMITKQMVALDGNGLIIELTAKNETRFYLHHDKLGDSNPVNLSLDGNKEYKMEAWNETKLSIVISGSTPGADVYMDGEYKGMIGSDKHLSMKDVAMGSHQLTIKNGSSEVVRQIQVTPDQVYFNLDSQHQSNLQGFVLFRVIPENAQVWLDGEFMPVVNGVAQKLARYGTYSYSIQAPGYYTVHGELVVRSGQVAQDVTMELVSNAAGSYQDYGRIRVEGGNIDGAQVFVDAEYVGDAPLTTKYFAPGEHSVKISKKNYFSYESSVSIDRKSIYLLSPVLKPDFMTVRLIADEDAEIWVNGELKGVGVWKGDLANGEYLVESRKANHKTASDRITVKEDMPSTDLRLSHLQAISGFLAVSSTPIGAEIHIDDKVKGVTPLFLNDITVGPHKVSIIKEGYEQWNETITIIEGQEMTLSPVLLKLGVDTKEITGLTRESVMSGGVVVDDGKSEVLSKGVVWSLWPEPTANLSTKIDAGNGTAPFDCDIKGLLPSTKYYLRAYVVTPEGTFYGDQKEFTTVGEKGEFHGVDLASEGSANCYIISSAGTYSFPPVKGNSSESVGAVASIDVLWESFGTNEKPSAGDLISLARYMNGKIILRTVDIFTEGNAVVAAKDNKGKILWSWHIWMTDRPQEQHYDNSNVVMLDRNLGAVSSTPGHIGALGLMYQWGRKDPFLNVADFVHFKVAKSTKQNQGVFSSPKNGNVNYSIENPNNFISGEITTSQDWIYEKRNDGLWASDKTIYDPCPVGWRVPDGDVWDQLNFSDVIFDKVNYGLELQVNSNESSWYPATGSRTSASKFPFAVGMQGGYWSNGTTGDNAYFFFFARNGLILPMDDCPRSYGLSIRCLKDSE